MSAPEVPCDQNPCTHDTCVGGECLVTLVQCDDGDPCTVDGCDLATGTCGSAPAPAGTPCVADRCHQPGACHEGACVAGPAIVCPSDGNPCTADACDPVVGCTYETKPDAAACGVEGDDGNECTRDVCRHGRCEHENANGRLCTWAACQPLGVCAAGTCEPLDNLCAPGAPCPDTDGRSCDDGNPCTTVSSCQSGLCAGSCPAPCPTDGVACDDQNVCSPASACAEGVCAGIGCDVGLTCVEACGFTCGDMPDCRCGF